MASETKSSLTLVNDASVGTVAWSDAAFASATNDLYATFTGGNSVVSNYLKLTNFSFSIPSGDMIDGIEVKIERKGSIASRLLDNIVRLVVGDTIQGDDNATGTNYPTGDTIATYGSSSDLWGLSLSDTDVNASDFGMVISSKRTSGGGTNTASIDHITITVYHSSIDTSPKTLGAGAGGNIPGPDANWILESGITASDNSYASLGVLLAADEQTDYLEASLFGFNLPVDAVVNGIEVSFETSKQDSSPDFIDSSVYIRKDRVNVGTEKTPSNLFSSTSDDTVILGSSSDLWGTTWTYSDINDIGFGAAIRAIRDSAGGTNVPKVDYISITVYFDGAVQRRIFTIT